MGTQRGKQRTDNQYRGSPDWYTPPWLLGMVSEFLGEYLDPCPALYGTTLQRNGLLMPWRGKVYVNPPYGRDIVPWVTKAMTEPVSELILLVPAYTDTRWFAPLFEHTICFVHGRIAFVRPQAEGGGLKRAPHPSALIYRGSRHALFARRFSEVGTVLRTYQPRRAKQPELWKAS